MHWTRKWQPTPEFLPGESHRQRRLAGHSPWGHTEADKTEGTTWYVHVIRALHHVSPPHPLAWDLGLRGGFWEIPSQDTRLRCQEVQTKGQAVAHSPDERPLSTQTPAEHSRAVILPEVRFATGAAQTLHVASRPAEPRAQLPLAQEAAEFLLAAPDFLEMLSSGPVPQEGVGGSLWAQPRLPHLFCTWQLLAVNLGSCLSGKGAGEWLLLKLLPLGLSVL